ncbi:MULTISPECIES: lipid-A-disaccharide synthase [Agrobacterium]|jgi:lipid-A-disaccharide synthase|uniref:lipid-A-disaccharide synthase n=2 Tax=Agrobacterium TaxID=357 RepID=UPI00088F8F65|nr:MULTISPECIES: lipid-A-disaccharide synthase [Agrobacterium]TGR66952.1 lipid-A-disaccharide synthase [bacterium M00.F.Ca.ET.194.01.1.1]TGS53499.1 lipid-A-disaccharide synthase [bacterium M00.F.Ca.ET.179.01.1.1]TGV46259.1 lipid-A-disaccharide synthase [bacterium M00.F.Ca.ET.168.01.1.1]MBW9057447.1 lipid-A-disaccharide synthase [Agrobacterium pusense]MRG64756.1 lipid-A-disaccharide synthase [Agrobacterium pusense]
MTERLKVAVIAGEVSGDLLGADLIRALKARYPGSIELVGVGGEALEGQGLTSLFDYSELSIMGFTQVLKKLPKLIGLINRAAEAVIREKPDVLLIIDSPDFTHRVAKKVRKELPHLPVVNYVCPSVWAWKEHRATAMLSYVDHVLALLPFEPEAMRSLGGPPTTFVGHRLSVDPDVLAVRRKRAERPLPAEGRPKTILLLPGSRSTETTRLMEPFQHAAKAFVERNGPTRFLLPTVPRQEHRIRELAASWPQEIRPEIGIDPAFKWNSFAEADAAIAASGTVILELALAGVPTISVYKTDWIFTMLSKRVKTWTGALPNLIADYAVVPEYFNEVVRAGSMLRWAERLSSDTIERKAMLEGYALVQQRLRTDVPPGETGAAILLEVVNARRQRG